MVTVKEIIYGKEYPYLCFLDFTLAMFKNIDFINNNTLYKSDSPPDFDNTLRQLETDGMLIINKNGVRITLKGKQKLRKGGYKQKAFVNRLTFFLITIGTIASAITIIG
jgi:hypothetical protein